jgi:hypothetical protein
MLYALVFPIQSASQAPLHVLDLAILNVLEQTDNICFNGNADRVFRGWHHVDVSYIGDTSETLTVSNFKTKILTFSNAACINLVPSPQNILVRLHSKAVQA